MRSCVHYQFEDQVRRTPDSVAVAMGCESLTYDALNRKANQLARYLTAVGVARNDLVAVCLEYSLELPVALLGVLKAGAAYVPIDPAYPALRVEAMATQTGAPVVLTQADLEHSYPPACRVVCLESAPAATLSDDNPARMNSDRDLVYCIFSSGSTGTPKGALNLHGGFSNLCAWYSGAEARGGSNSRTLVVSSIAFDLTQKNIFEPLITGGLVIFGNRKVGDIDAMDAAVRLHRPTRINCAPSAFLALQDVVMCDSLQILVLGGEPVSVALAESIVRRGVEVMNSYGPAECCDVAMYHTGFAVEDDCVPLGKPVPNVDIYLLDNVLRCIQGPGEGEIYIGGAGVGLGYVGRDDLTADKFIPNPFSNKPGNVYRTGDLAERTPDGKLRYLGRRDDQVKIRGNRVEIGEVEAALLSHEGIVNAAVVAYEHAPGQVRLAAFVVPAEGPLSRDNLRDYLGALLPAFMLPSVWNFRTALPLNASGKADRARLRQEVFSEARAASTCTGESTPDEETLSQICRVIFREPAIGVQDDLFAWGMDSLSMIQILMAIREELHCDISLEALYSARTIRTLANRVGASDRPQTRRCNVPAPPGDYEFTPSFSQAQDLTKPAGDFTFLKNFTLGFRLSGRLDLDRFSRALAQTIQRQEALRASFVRDPAGKLMGRIARIAAADIEVVPLPGAKAEFMSDIRRTRFDVSVAPLLRCAVGARSDETCIFAFNLHHSIADAWSMGVLARDLGRAYSSVAAGDSGRFTGFISAEREALANGIFDAKERFWSEQLTNLPKQIAIPLANVSRPPVFTYSADAVKLEFGETGTNSIRSLCAREGVTPYIVLLTSLFLLLNRYTREEDLYIRSPAWNREDPALVDTIGPFGSAIIIRVPVQAGMPALAVLQRVRQSAINAYAQVGLPGHLLGRCIPPSNDPSLGSRFQVNYNHHNYPPPPATWGDIAITKLEEDFSCIKTDLAVHSWFDRGALCGELAFYTGVLTRDNAQILARDLKAIVAELCGT